MGYCRMYRTRRTHRDNDMNCLQLIAVLSVIAYQYEAISEHNYEQIYLAT